MTKKYDVVDGVNWINGKEVPADRQVILTKEQSVFELAQGRVRETKPKTVRKGKTQTEIDIDG